MASFALMLAGCASTPDQAAPGSTDTTATADSGKDAGERDGGQSVPGEDAGDLADLAEDLAKEGEDEGDIAPVDGALLGADISWPQCPPGMGIPEKRTLGMPMPVPEAQFVIVGLTNGPGFTPNPCLTDQVDWVSDHQLMLAAYAVSSYPDADTLAEYGDQGPFDAASDLGRLRNVGYQQARYNIGNMGSAGLQTPIVWIDVEPVPDFAWSSDKTANAAVIEGAARGYVDAGYEIGVYSTPHLWDEVVGDLRLEVPEWRAAGETSREEALSRCGDDWSIQGGEAVFGQWVEQRRDHNVTCPGIAADLGRWFHQT
ncbi:hypothetical protein FXB39_19075 [Nocardioides sp. BGMRC 2183]|nr:hypothetical protein FXB39_19075 [Nocardioides sp. BGMRC 2183]